MTDAQKNHHHAFINKEAQCNLLMIFKCVMVFVCLYVCTHDMNRCPFYFIKNDHFYDKNTSNVHDKIIMERLLVRIDDNKCM